jgi:hypothetical protein
MRPIEHEAIVLCFAGELPGVLGENRQVCVQGSNRNGRKRKQVDPQVSQCRQQLISFPGSVLHGGSQDRLQLLSRRAAANTLSARSAM